MSTSLTSKYPFLDPPLDANDLGSVGPYRVISELGRGGMGFVFEAEDTRLKRVVALKMMNQKIASTANSRRRFIEEARSMAAVKHDNVATIYEVNDQFSTPFMAMELLKGQTLEAKCRTDKQHDYQTVIRFATEIARGLAAAHAQGIIHRDIKPANIWIEADTERIKILDFGLALANVPVDQIAARGSVIGTPQYLSPEQASSELLDDRTDLYSLGVVLFELCTGQLPFRVKSVADQLLATLVHKPPRVSKINPEIPEPLADLIAKLLEKEPRRRPRSASDLEKLLNKVAVECEAKSDVALAINKLQAQLSSVVTKQPDPFSASSVATAAAPVFADLGDSAFSQLPIPSAAAALQSAVGKSGAVRTLGPATTFAKPVASSQKTSREFAFPVLPVAAIGATAIVLMAIVGGVWYGTMSASSRVGNTIVLPTPSPPTPSPPAPSALVPSPPAISQNQTRSAAPPPKVNNQNSKKPGNKPSGSGNQFSKNTPNSSSPDSKPVPQETAFDPEKSANDKPKIPNSDTVVSAPRSNEALPELSSVVKPIETKVFETRSRTTGEGRGADTTTKRGGAKSEQLGEEIAIAVQTRGPIDIQHGYLRFDIKGLISNNEKSVGAELVLSLPRTLVLEGSRLRVYGIPQAIRDDWAETGPRALVWANSYSTQPLSENELLADITFTGKEAALEVRIRDERLTTFVQGVKEEFVSLLLAGGSPDSKPLYFVSREGDSAKAPTLHIEVANDKD